MSKKSLREEAHERLAALGLVLPYKPVWWVGQAKQEVLALPESVRHEVGVAVRAAQGSRTAHGVRKHIDGSFRGWDVAYASMPFDGDTYRAFFTVAAFSDVIFVLCAFQKKSTQGIATPKVKLALVETRYSMAKALYKEPPTDLAKAIKRYHAECDAQSPAVPSTPRPRGRKS